MKIEQIHEAPEKPSDPTKLDNKNQGLLGEGSVQQTADLEPPATSFSNVEEAPITNLKQQIIEKQAEANKNNPQQAADSITNAYNPNENFKGTLKPGKDDTAADLSIMSYQLKAPIKLKTEYDPQSDLEKILL